MAQNPAGRSGNTTTLPEEIVESLCRCGGLAGLTKRLPTEDNLNDRNTTLRALADPIRLKILAMLLVQPLCVCVIKAMLEIADSKLSYHPSALRKAGLIVGDRQGNWIIYRLTGKGTEWTAFAAGVRTSGTDR